MNRSVYEQEQARKAKVRLRMLQHAEKITHNVSQTCRFFGICRAQFYIWKHRFEKQGAEGLRDRSRRPSMIRYRIPPEVIALILRIREERRYGLVRVSLYLQRHYQVYVSPPTILKIFHRHHVGRVSLKRYRPGPKLQAEGPLPVPGRLVQVDVKFVPRLGRARQRFYKFTATDEAARYSVLCIYDYNNTRSALQFLEEVRQRRPFAIQRIQTDNGSSFGPQFTWHLAALRQPLRSSSGLPPGLPTLVLSLCSQTPPRDFSLIFITIQCPKKS